MASTEALCSSGGSDRKE